MRKAYPLFFSLLLLVSTTSIAQVVNGKFYDLRMVVNNADCPNNVLYIDVEVKASDPGAVPNQYEFYMGSQNYKYSYNRKAINNPQVEQSFAFDAFPYSPHNTGASVDPGVGDTAITIVNVTWFPFGVNGTLVRDSVWTPVTRIKYDIVDPQQLDCLGLTWRDSSYSFHFTAVTKVDSAPPPNSGLSGTYVTTSPVDEMVYVNDGGCLGIICGTLPVEWSNFEGELIGEDAALNWELSYEANNDYFAVERSLDGSNFNEIGRVKGAGFSNQITNYEYLDEDVTRLGVSKVFYQIRQVDEDGEASFSSVVEIFIGQQDEIGLEVYPNPASDQVNISYKTSSSNGLTVEILDVKGQKVITRDVAEPEGILTLDTRSLAPGVYLIKAYSEKHSETTKLIVR